MNKFNQVFSTNQVPFQRCPSPLSLANPLADVDPLPSVSSEHTPAQGGRRRTRPGPGSLPGRQSRTGTLPSPQLTSPRRAGGDGRRLSPGRQAVAGEAGCDRTASGIHLGSRGAGGASLPPLQPLLQARLLALPHVLLPWVLLDTLQRFLRERGSVT